MIVSGRNFWLTPHEAVMKCDELLSRGFHLSVKTNEFNTDIQTFLDTKFPGSWLFDWDGKKYFLQTPRRT